MNKKKIIGTILALVLIGGGIVAFTIFQPHRSVENTKADHSYNASELVSEYLTDVNAANAKYLDEEGESNVFEIKGNVSTISEDYNGQTLVLLKTETDKAGVSCTFTTEQSSEAKTIALGTEIRIKGVIESGASYDEDLEMYENVIMDECTLLKTY